MSTGTEKGKNEREGGVVWIERSTSTRLPFHSLDFPFSLRMSHKFLYYIRTLRWGHRTIFDIVQRPDPDTESKAEKPLALDKYRGGSTFTDVEIEQVIPYPNRCELFKRTFRITDSMADSTMPVKPLHFP